MKIGVDSSILVAGLHANHPFHGPAANWLLHNIPLHQLIAAHHTILETYAVLTRLPGTLRITGPEAKQLLGTTVRPNVQIAAFSGASIWDCVDSLVEKAAAGGQSYDAFIAGILVSAGVEAIVTFNTRHFSQFADDLALIDPSKPS